MLDGLTLASAFQFPEAKGGVSTYESPECKFMRIGDSGTIPQAALLMQEVWSEADAKREELRKR
jgi:hypothetical protein